MKRIIVLLLALLLALPASAHRRYISYVTAQVSDTTAGGFTAITELAMPALASRVLFARCYIVTTASSSSVGVALGATGPTTGGPVLTAVYEPEWPEQLSSQVTNIERGGIDGTCAAGQTCITNPNTPFIDGEWVHFVNAGDMSQIVGITAQIENHTGFPNYLELPIDSRYFTPWGGLTATLVRDNPGKQFFTAFPFLPNLASTAPSSLGSTRVLTNLRLLLKNGTVAGTVTPTFTAAVAGTANVEVGSWCEYSYEVGS